MMTDGSRHFPACVCAKLLTVQDPRIYLPTLYLALDDCQFSLDNRYGCLPSSAVKICCSSSLSTDYLNNSFNVSLFQIFESLISPTVTKHNTESLIGPFPHSFSAIVHNINSARVMFYLMLRVIQWFCLLFN